MHGANGFDLDFSVGIAILGRAEDVGSSSFDALEIRGHDEELLVFEEGSSDHVDGEEDFRGAPVGASFGPAYRFARTEIAGGGWNWRGLRGSHYLRCSGEETPESGHLAQSDEHAKNNDNDYENRVALVIFRQIAQTATSGMNLGKMTYVRPGWYQSTLSLSPGISADRRSVDTPEEMDDEDSRMTANEFNKINLNTPYLIEESRKFDSQGGRWRLGDVGLGVAQGVTGR